MSREGALWIGGLEPYMDEEYLTKAFNAMGEENVVSIKVPVINQSINPLSWSVPVKWRRSHPQSTQSSKGCFLAYIPS
jgi:hypothetical protein